MQPSPVRLREHALPDPTPGKQCCIYLGLRQLGNVIPTKSRQLRCIQDSLNAMPGYLMSGLNRSTLQVLTTQLQPQLRFNLPYLYQYSFHHVAITWWREPYRWCLTTPIVVLNHAGSTAKRWRSPSPQAEPTEANIQPGHDAHAPDEKAVGGPRPGLDSPAGSNGNGQQRRRCGAATSAVPCGMLLRDR